MLLVFFFISDRGTNFPDFVKILFAKVLGGVGTFLKEGSDKNLINRIFCNEIQTGRFVCW